MKKACPRFVLCFQRCNEPRARLTEVGGAVESKPSLRVAAGVIARDGRILICQRRDSDRHPGKWEFPGGKVEPGETAEDCVRRELREELGVESSPLCELWHTQHDYGVAQIVLVFWSIGDLDREPRNLCFAEIRWVSVTELPTYDFLDADRDFVLRLADRQFAL